MTVPLLADCYRRGYALPLLLHPASGGRKPPERASASSSGGLRPPLAGPRRQRLRADAHHRHRRRLPAPVVVVDDDAVAVAVRDAARVKVAALPPALGARPLAEQRERHRPLRRHLPAVAV